MDKYKLFSVSVLLLCFCEFSNGDREMNEGGIYCKARGRSGKIALGFQQNVDSDPNRITIDFDELKERDISNNDVGKTGRIKHSFNSFASQDFTFTDPTDSALQNISVKTFQFKANLFENATLRVDVYIFKENGTVNSDDEEINVTRGNVKFSVSITNWKFCGTDGTDVQCRKGQTNEVGAFIDFTITIKGKGTPRRKNDTDNEDGGKKSKKRGERFELGGESEVILSNKVKYDDGNWTEMASGYPKLVTQGSKTSFVFRFNKFSNSVFYDPTVELDTSSSSVTTTKPGDTDGASVTTASVVLSTILMLMSAILVGEY